MYDADAKNVAQLREEWEKRYPVATEAEIETEESLISAEAKDAGADADFETWVHRQYATLRLESRRGFLISLTKLKHAETQLGIKENTILRLEAQLNDNDARNRLCATLLEMVNEGSFTHKEKDGALKLISAILTHPNPAEFAPTPSNGNGDFSPF